MCCIFTSLNPILGCIWTHLIGGFLCISGGTLNGGYGNSCKVLKQPFHLAFLLTCICSRNWFSLLCPFFLCPPSRSSCLGLLEEVERTGGGFRPQTCSECRVCQAEAQGTAQLWEHLQEESEQGTGMKLLHSPTQHRLSACKSARLSNRLSVCLYCLYVAKRIVPFLLFTFSHSQPPPLCSPLFVPHWLSHSAPAEASALVDEIVMVIIVMVIVIFCKGWQRGWKP